MTDATHDAARETAYNLRQATEDREADVQQEKFITTSGTRVGPWRYTPTSANIMNSTTFPDVAELVTRIEALEAWGKELRQELTLHYNAPDWRVDQHAQDITGLQERLAIIVSDISDQRDRLDETRGMVNRMVDSAFARTQHKLDELLVAEELLALIHDEITGDHPSGDRLAGMAQAWEILVKNATP